MGFQLGQKEYFFDDGLGFGLQAPSSEEGPPRPIATDEVLNFITLANGRDNVPEPEETVLVGLWDPGEQQRVLVPVICLGTRRDLPEEFEGDVANGQFARWSYYADRNGNAGSKDLFFVLPPQILANTPAMNRISYMAGICRHIGFIKSPSQLDGSPVTNPVFRINQDRHIVYGTDGQ